MVIINNQAGIDATTDRQADLDYYGVSEAFRS